MPAKAGGGSSRSRIPAMPPARIADSARYGLQSTAGTRCSILAEPGSRVTVRTAADLFASPQVTVVGGPAISTRRRYELTVGLNNDIAAGIVASSPATQLAQQRRLGGAGLGVKRVCRAVAEREVDVHRGAEVLVGQGHEGDASAKLAGDLAQGELGPDHVVGGAQRVGRGRC